MVQEPNSSAAELAHFSGLASGWWDPNGALRTLHDLNPVRLAWVEEVAGLAGQQVLDVGCGGGLLSEAMARKGAVVTGIDMSGDALTIARLHLLESAPLAVTYREMSGEQFAGESPHSFDVVTCMELLEHVPDPASLVAACATLVKPGGSVVFSTINRTPTAFVTAILGAEYLTGLVPPGTHRYAQFIRPSELDGWGRAAGLRLISLTGGAYNPVSRVFSLTPNASVNYFAHFRAHQSHD